MSLLTHVKTLQMKPGCFWMTMIDRFFWCAIAGGEDDEEKKEAWFPGGSRAVYVEDVLDFDAPFNCRLSLKDFDRLISDLDRELAKHINICM